MSETKLLLLAPDRLKRHPKQVRRRYPPDEIREMADSLKARGNLTPLSVVPNGQPGCYYVVRGSKRLAGAELAAREGWMGKLKCDVVAETEAEAMLGMIAENVVRGDVDVISEARHYADLKRGDPERGRAPMSVRQIAAQTGVNELRVRHRLSLLELDEPIQEMLAEDKLSHDHRIVAALLSIAGAQTRVAFAERMQGRSIRAIVMAAESLNQKLRAGRDAEKAAGGKPAGRPRAVTGTPMLDEASRAAALPAPGRRATWEAIRESAAITCGTCDIRKYTLKDAVAEPAWALIAHAAGETCSGCSLREIKSACGTCPAVEVMTRLARAVERAA